MSKNPFEVPAQEPVSAKTEKQEENEKQFEELLAASAEVEIKTPAGKGVKDYGEAVDRVMLEVLRYEGIAGKDETLSHQEILNTFYSSYFSLITINNGIKQASQHFSREIDNEPRNNLSTGKEARVTSKNYRSFDTARGDFQNAADILLITVARDRLREVGMTDVYGDPKGDTTRALTQEKYMMIRDAIMTEPSTPNFVKDHIRKLETPELPKKKVEAPEAKTPTKETENFPPFPENYKDAQAFFYYLQAHAKKQSHTSELLGSKKGGHPQASTTWIFETPNGNYKIDLGYGNKNAVTRVRISTLGKDGNPSRPKEFLRPSE